MTHTAKSITKLAGMTHGQHQDGGSIWFGGRTFDDGTLEEFDEDCAFPCGDLSELSA